MRLNYEWRANVQDGKVFNFFDDETGKEQSVLNALRYPVQMRQFQLIERATGKPKVTIHVKPGMKVIYHMRTRLHTHYVWGGTKEERHKELQSRLKERPPIMRLYITGWQERRAPNKYLGKTPGPNECVNFQSLIFLNDDGHMEMANGFMDVEPYSPVNFSPEEMPDEG